MPIDFNYQRTNPPEVETPIRLYLVGVLSIRVRGHGNLTLFRAGKVTETIAGMVRVRS